MRKATTITAIIGFAVILASWPLGFLSPALADEAADTGNGAQTRAELCHTACERDYAICNDESAASRDSLNGRSSSAVHDYHCKADLTTCMAGCKGL